MHATTQQHQGKSLPEQNMYIYCSLVFLLAIIVKIRAHQDHWSAQQVNVSSDDNATFICSNFTPIVRMEEIVIGLKKEWRFYCLVENNSTFSSGFWLEISTGDSISYNCGPNQIWSGFRTTRINKIQRTWTLYCSPIPPDWYVTTECSVSNMKGFPEKVSPTLPPNSFYVGIYLEYKLVYQGYEWKLEYCLVSDEVTIICFPNSCTETLDNGYAIETDGIIEYSCVQGYQVIGPSIINVSVVQPHIPICKECCGEVDIVGSETILCHNDSLTVTCMQSRRWSGPDLLCSSDFNSTLHTCCEYDTEIKDCTAISCITGRTECVSCTNSTVLNKAKTKCGYKGHVMSLSLTKLYSDYSLSENPFAVYCDCEGSLPFSVHWFDDTVNDDKEIMLFRNIKKVPVNIRNITVNIYCKVRNEYGSHYRNLSLANVKFLMLDPIIAQYVLVNTSCDLHCVIEGDVFYFKWSFNDIPLYVNTSLYSILPNSTLRLHFVRISGVYKCEAFNLLATHFKEVLVTFSEKVTTNDTIAPKIIKFVHNYTAVLGGSVDLSCLAIGEPIPLIMWSRGSRILSPRAGEVKLKHERILTLHNVKRNDAGIYVCTAKNTIGMDNYAVILTVIKPSVVIPTTKSIVLSSNTPTFVPSSWDDGTYLLVLLVTVYIITLIVALCLMCVIHLLTRNY